MALYLGLSGGSARAANPLANLQFSADPTAHVFNGRLYVYPSHDRNDAREFDMTDHPVYSTDDLQNWQDHGAALDIKDVPWALKHMWAPDCACKDGTYYFYFPVSPKSGGGALVGVATGLSPAGPRVASETEGGAIELHLDGLDGPRSAFAPCRTPGVGRSGRMFPAGSREEQAFILSI